VFTQHSRALAGGQIALDFCLGAAGFILAYLLRFETGFIPAPKGQPPVEQYLFLAPFIGVLVPLAYQLQGAYKLKHNRTRIDDFFTTFIGSLLAIVIGLLGTLYFQVYYVLPEARDSGVYEVSRMVWALFLLFNVCLTYGSRDVLRLLAERRHRAGLGVHRVLIAGAGDLARHVADRFLHHGRYGHTVVGFIDDIKENHLGYRGLPLLGKLAEAKEIVQREHIDQIYVALPLGQHLRMLELIETANQECIDIKIIPDFLQFVTLRAKLEDLDGIPIININDVPLRGINSVVKRTLDIGLATLGLLFLSIPFAVIAVAIRVTSAGPAFYRQERMGLDGHPFMVLKFRSMFDGAERDTGPVWTRENDPRRTTIGRYLRRFSLDEFPQLWNVIKGDMSLVGPRPERPFFVDKFKQRLPHYMLRHKVKSGMTGWAQVNGWRGNTSIEKRIEYDLYYIENWSVTLDMKIIWLTIIWLGFHKHAY